MLSAKSIAPVTFISGDVIILVGGRLELDQQATLQIEWVRQLMLQKMLGLRPRTADTKEEFMSRINSL